MMSPLISTIVGSSPSHSPETISGVKESDEGKILYQNLMSMRKYIRYQLQYYP